MNTRLFTKVTLLILASLVLGSPTAGFGQKKGKLIVGKKPAPPIEGAIESVWVDHNYREGMRIHVKFRLVDVKNVRCQAVAYFFHDSGEKIRTSKKKYRAAGGQLAVGNLLWVTTSKEGESAEMTIHLPYREIPLSEGEHDLKFLVHLSAEGKTVDQSKAHRFRIRR